MQMTFGTSTNLTLLFDFWSVSGPSGMVLSVFVVFLLTILYEVLKVWRVWLASSSELAQPQSPYAAPPPFHSDSVSVVDHCASETSLTPMKSHFPPSSNRKSWLLHGVQTVLHVLQVTLGYMLMLCVMSYNTWIFLGVIVGSALGYLISFPVLDRT